MSGASGAMSGTLRNPAPILYTIFGLFIERIGMYFEPEPYIRKLFAPIYVSFKNQLLI